MRITRLEQISLVYTVGKSKGSAGLLCDVCDMPEDLSYIGVILPRARNTFTSEHCSVNKTLAYSFFSAQPL